MRRPGRRGTRWASAPALLVALLAVKPSRPHVPRPHCRPSRPRDMTQGVMPPTGAHGADLRDHRHFSTNAGSPWATHTSCTDHGTSRSGSAPAGWMTQECGPDLVHLSPRHAVRVQSRTSTKADSRERDLFPAAGARPSPSRVPAASTWQLGSFATWVGVCLGRRTAGRRMRT